MEATQPMDFGDDDFPNDDFDENQKTQYGVIKIIGFPPGSLDEAAAKEFDVFGGETMIGRDPEQCNIVINHKVIFNSS